MAVGHGGYLRDGNRLCGSARTPPLPNPSAPADFATAAGGPETFSPPADTQPTGTAPSYYAGEGTEPTAPRVEMSLWDTITDSLFGDVYAPGRWRPLPLRTFFSEGWFEPWAGIRQARTT